MKKTLTLGVLLACLCGCIKNKDELTLNADGSGKVRIETQRSLPPEMGEGMALGRMGGLSVVYPPTSEAEAQKFFPQKDFTVKVTAQRGTNGETTTIIEAEFKDINALLASPYGHAHELTAKIADGALVVRGVSGMEASARYAEMKDDTGMITAQIPGYADLQKKKGEMRSEFRVTLPNTVSAGNGARDGKTVVWIVERAKCKDADDFAQQLGALSEAKCPADGLTMKPAPLVRMGLLPFAELAAGISEAGAAVDTNKIAAAAKFVPYGLSVMRTLDLSGEGGSRESAAELTGAVILPKDFTPQKWGAVKLDEAVDAKGNNLKPAEADEERRFGSQVRYSGSANEDDAEADTNNVCSHVVSIGFRPPDWKVNEIARIKGSVSLQYFAGAQVLKLTNAIPAKWIADQSKMMNGEMDFSDKPLDSAALDGVGLKLSVQSGMIQAGMTILTVRAKGDAALKDVQVFDVNGRPWPTFLQEQDYGGESGSCQIMVAGKPQAPLSLALQVSGNGATVPVPVLVEHVSLTK
jgi:hypothetical protein